MSRKPKKMMTCTAAKNKKILKLILSLTAFLIILVLPQISAAEIQFQKNTSVFDQGETILSIVSGNFVEQPTEDNVFFYRGTVRIPMDFQIEKINSKFYVSAILVGKNAGNYSISIEGTTYINGTQTDSEDFSKNFSITENVSDFSVQPGFQKINQDSFFVEIQNLKGSSITVGIKSENVASESGTSISLASGETKRLNFQADSKFSSGTIVFSSENTMYSFPVFISGNSTDATAEDKNAGFKFEPNSIDVSLATDSESKRIIYAVNTGDVDLNEVTFFVSKSLEPFISIIPNTFDLNQNETEKIEIAITSDSEEKILEGQIMATAMQDNVTNITSSIDVVLNFVDDYVPPSGEEEKEVVLTTCAQLNGNICATPLKCSGEIAQVKEGDCCLAECKEVQKSSKGKIIGWGIIILIILFLFWFYTRRYRGVGSYRR